MASCSSSSTPSAVTVKRKPWPVQDRLDDGLVLFAVYQGLDEASVELHLVRRQVAQIGERRVAGAEIIDGEQNAELLELAHSGDALQPVLQHHGFSHLQQQAGRRHPVSRSMYSTCCTKPTVWNWRALTLTDRWGMASPRLSQKLYWAQAVFITQ